MAKTDKQSTKAKIVIPLLRFLANRSLGVSKAILRPLVWIQRFVPNKSKNVIDINLQTCLPELTLQQRLAIRNENIKHNIELFAEIAYIWFHHYEDNKKLIHQVNGLTEFKAALAEDKGTLVISPHFGNWELIWAYMGNEFQSAGLYRPPRIKELESVRLQGSAGEVVRTRAIDVRKMLKILKQGRCLFLLPDQQPPEGSGEFAPFFGQPAYTMTLLHGLANRTKSDIWMVTCLRQGEGYVLSFHELPLDGQLPVEQFNTELNSQMAYFIKQQPEQYQWSYKRFKKRPRGMEKFY